MSLIYTPGANDPTGPYSAGGTCDYGQLNNIENGVSQATTQINTNITTIGDKVDGTHGFYNGFKLFVGPTTPTGMAKGDVWIKTPFS